ncbi:MAG TPA: nuclear transport factor 2 family protein [Streptosporangiaceae bacterium]|nr:nuclear transport factor 2 family protein [Streptosporangiaceae bacterium]
MSVETDVVDAQIEAYRARDVEQFLSHYAADASVVMFDGTVMFATKEAMRERYGQLFADSPDLQVTIASRVAAGEFVVDEEHLSGFHVADMPTELTAIAVYRVTAGKIARLMLLS